MGEAQVGLADDVYSTYWNPAGMAQLRSQELGAVYTKYLESINEQYLAYAYPTQGKGTFGASLTYLSVGSIQGTDAQDTQTSSVDSNDLALGLSYSRYLHYDPRTGAGIAAGITGKVIRESLASVSGKAYAVDAGLLFTPGLAWGETLQGLKGGLAVKNLGTSLKFDQESFPLPRVLTAGASYTGHFLGEAMTVALDARQPNDSQRSIGVGMELLTLGIFAARVGYTSAGDLGNGLRVGAGLRFRTIQVDYAYAAQGDFGAVQRIGITFKFAPLERNNLVAAQTWYQRGVRSYKSRRYTQALVEFNKALELDPTHPQALEMMKKTYEKIRLLVPAE